MSASMRIVFVNKLQQCIIFSQKSCVHTSFNILQRQHTETGAKYFGRTGSPNKYREIKMDGEEFRVLVIPGHTQLPEADKRPTRVKPPVPPARYRSMDPKQDWTDVWPTASSFKWSVVPFPVRMGIAQREENSGIPPGKYGNAELMKIPNFLHLTPAHIRKHCRALAPLCTPWPEGLPTDEDADTHFPLTVTTREYVRDAPTHTDARARTVTLKVKLSSLSLDGHARDKLLRLVGDRYDNKTDTLTLQSDRCPLRRQNEDYVNYLLSVVYYEAWKTEPWESEKEVSDMERYFWDLMPSKTSLTRTLNAAAQTTEAPPGDPLDSDAVREYSDAVETLHNHGEDLATLQRYKQSVKKLLLSHRGT